MTTARQLITNAYYLSGVVSKDFQTVKGDQLNEGLGLLNDILSVRALDTKRIPFFKEYDLTAVVGQEKYFIPGLLIAETFVFYIGDVRYSTHVHNRDKYFGSSRPENIRSLPYSYHIERVKDGSDLYVYFLPNSAYPMKIWGKFGLDEVTSVDENLSVVYERNYLTYLRYLLAEYICTEYNVTMQPNVAKKLKDLEKDVTWISPLDLSMNVISTLSEADYPNWADVNIGGGWRP
ncbi:MAG: hypothetical protein FK731_15605 [Asgard group archaeon]|nr:hypothetical protein [Asgard group archaeon]